MLLKRCSPYLVATVALLLIAACGGLSEAEKQHNSGAALQEEGRYEEAIRAYDEAIRLDSQFAVAYGGRGLAYDSLGQHQRAIQDLDEAIRLDPQLAMAYNNRGLAYDNLGQHQRAIQDLDEAIRLDPQLALVLSQPNCWQDRDGEA